ncbi:unnamed protein product [Closterium sp. Yama58-4]|nr:unnamed protein product [Closterium sp. Yama58-4]
MSSEPPPFSEHNPHQSHLPHYATNARQPSSLRFSFDNKCALGSGEIPAGNAEAARRIGGGGEGGWGAETRPADGEAAPSRHINTGAYPAQGFGGSFGGSGGPQPAGLYQAQFYGEFRQQGNPRNQNGGDWRGGEGGFVREDQEQEQAEGQAENSKSVPLGGWSPGERADFGPVSGDYSGAPSVSVPPEPPSTAAGEAADWAAAAAAAARRQAWEHVGRVPVAAGTVPVAGGDNNEWEAQSNSSNSAPPPLPPGYVSSESREGGGGGRGAEGQGEEVVWRGDRRLGGESGGEFGGVSRDGGMRGEERSALNDYAMVPSAGGGEVVGGGGVRGRGSGMGRGGGGQRFVSQSNRDFAAAEAAAAAAAAAAVAAARAAAEEAAVPDAPPPEASGEVSKYQEPSSSLQISAGRNGGARGANAGMGAENTGGQQRFSVRGGAGGVAGEAGAGGYVGGGVRMSMGGGGFGPFGLRPKRPEVSGEVASIWLNRWLQPPTAAAAGGGGAGAGAGAGGAQENPLSLPVSGEFPGGGTVSGSASQGSASPAASAGSGGAAAAVAAVAAGDGNSADSGGGGNMGYDFGYDMG